MCVQTKIDIFKESLKEIYSTSFPNVIKGLSGIKPTTLRVNRLKANLNEVVSSLRNQNFVIKPGPFENSFIITKAPIYISDTVEFKEGKIYVQELSSMIPPILLDPKPGENILDIAAAPGS